MATRKITYKPLGVRLRSLPQIQQTELAERSRGLTNLSNRLNQISADAFRAFGKEQALKGAKEGESFEAYKVEQDELGNTSIRFSEAPEMGTDPYSQSFYKAAQNSAKLQIKTLFEQKLYKAYTENRSNVANFNKAAEDISDGLLESLREKNPQLYNYFEYDFKQSSIAYAKSVYTNWSSSKLDIETTTFQGYVNSGHAANIIKMAAKGEDGLQKAGVFINNMVGDYLNLGPKEKFVAGNIAIDADETRLGIKNADALGKDITFARNTFQKIYLEEMFKQYKGNHPALVKAIEEVRNGTYITKDFFNTLMSDGQVVGVGDANISDILNDKDRDKLATDLFEIFHNETNRVNKLYEADKTTMKNQAYLDQSKILGKIINLERIDQATEISALEQEIEKDIELFEKTHPTEDGLKFAKTIKEAYFGRFNADDDEPGVKHPYEEDARYGMLNQDHLLKDTRLTGTTKAKILELANSYDRGEKHWTDHNLYKEGIQIINGLEAASVGGMFSINTSDAERNEKINFIYRKTFEHIIDDKKVAIGNSGQRINPVDVADTINQLNNDGKIIASKQEYASHNAGKDQSTGDSNYNQYKTLITLRETEEIKLAKATKAKEREKIQTRIDDLNKNLAEVEAKIPGGLKALENKTSKYDRTKVYYIDDNNQAVELTPKNVLKILVDNKYNLLNEDKTNRYKNILNLVGDPY